MIQSRRHDAKRDTHPRRHLFTHAMTLFLEAFENYFRPDDGSLDVRDASDDDDGDAQPPTARLILSRMYGLSFFPLCVCVYFVAIMIVESSAEFIGSAGLALLECIILRQTSFDATKGQSLSRVSHMRSVTSMFLAIACGKAFSVMYSTYDACKMPHEALGELECSHLRWLTTIVIAIFGYVTYVAMLAFARLEILYLLRLARLHSSSLRTMKPTAHEVV